MVYFYASFTTMGYTKSTKLNRLITEWPRGCVLTAQHLKSIGFSGHLIVKYRQGNWIRQIGRGAYILQGDVVDWSGGLYAIQTQQKLNIHVGGRTALEMLGYAHYISDKHRKIFLYGEKMQKIPAWFIDHDWQIDIQYCSTNLFPNDCKIGLTKRKEREYSIQISSAERAAMEMLYYVPNKVGFDEAMLIMENLTSLRPRVVQVLLEVCNFVKVKRLFMYMARKHAYSWVTKIDFSKVDLGKGKRVIVPNGILDKEFQITVPKMEEEVTY
ncbi:MAG: type IV toxin-antitoxin system AbiEi family antitoxin domain-containing protein [Thermodesulfobacteriota bacterium]|nr:type IV toxin-antitoxin system AbiEi family antitoxin domain-containing protein [Thermodesulfobacteriota bacterium]